jgi:hypothetical protein
VRPASVGKLAVIDYAQRGVIVKTSNLSEMINAVIQAPVGVDVIVCCLVLAQGEEEITLIEAYNKVNVGRHEVGFSSLVCPSRGIMKLKGIVSLSCQDFLKSHLKVC